MGKNTPEYQTYTKQKHRFDLNGCDLKYNNKSFNIGMKLEDVENVFGKKYIKEKNISYSKTELYFIFYEEEGIVALFDEGYLRDIYIYIQDEQKKEKYDIKGNKSVLFNNFILKQTDKMHEFLKTTNITFDDFEIESNGYMQRYTCNNKQLIYDINSPVAYFRTGRGHLYTRGNWNLDDTATIKYIHLYLTHIEPLTNQK